MPPPLARNDIATLTLKLAETARLLGQCALRHAGAVNAYEAARAEARTWNDQAN
ncbi:hypothetical protein [Sphingobium lignivorans]|uniref:Uncharacterized protein n=1 Tax=Sphingobium lignivorans TaxID=2735886 RepID=A0ABR6NC80_9SPHN|nr:hypothetical protein [Sphingobium lignivorans]MBB5984666.1 hypothetical protein [Sphingobium lignivorans]